MTGAIEWLRGLGRARAFAGVLIVLGATVGGAFAAGIVGMPAVSGVDNRFSAVDDETTTIDTALTVQNPNFFGIELGGVTVNYTVELNEVEFARGSKEGVDLSSGNATLGFRTTMSNERIPEWWVAHIRDGESSDLVVHAQVHSSTFGRSVGLTPVNREISTDLLSAFDSEEPRPVNADQPIVSDPVLYVNETSARWGSVSEDETPIEMDFTLYNPKATPFTVTALGYDITMNDVPVGSGETDQATTIPGRTSRTLEAVTTIRNGELDRWWVTHLQRDQVTDLRIEFYARVELGGGQEVRVPLDALTYTETMETDIFGTKNETGGVGGDSGGPSTDPGEGTTSEGAGTTTPTSESTGGQATETRTTSGPSTETEDTTSPTPTETEDDGGLLG